MEETNTELNSPYKFMAFYFLVPLFVVITMEIFNVPALLSSLF